MPGARPIYILKERIIGLCRVRHLVVTRLWYLQVTGRASVRLRASPRWQYNDLLKTGATLHELCQMRINDIVVCTETCANRYHHVHKDTVYVNPI